MAVTVQTMRERINIEGFADIPREIRIRFTAELDEQARLGQKATVVLVDNGSTQRLVNVKRRARAFYTDTARIAEAATLAWDMLERLTRVKTGRARASYKLYVRGRLFGGREDIDRAAKTMTDRDLMFIAGPTVPYGRKLYWRPAGRQRTINRTRTTRFRVGFKGSRQIKIKLRSLYVEPMHRTVQRVLRRRYPDVYSREKWIDLGGISWPSLSIGLRVNRTVH
jgi:hypothetical protein